MNITFYEKEETITYSNVLFMETGFGNMRFTYKKENGEIEDKSIPILLCEKIEIRGI